VPPAGHSARFGALGTGHAILAATDQASRKVAARITTTASVKRFQHSRLNWVHLFKEYDGSTGEAGVDINSGREMTTAQYVAEVDFTKGTANVTIEGIKENGAWKILYFYVSIVDAGQSDTASSTTLQ